MNELKAWIRAIDATKKSTQLTLPGLIDDLAERYCERVALIGETESLTYRNLARRMNGYARWAVSQGIAGKTVALLMHNCPEYVAIWLGLTRVGCKVALLNTNLRRDALTHCINVSAAKYLISSDDLLCFVDKWRVVAEYIPLPTVAACEPSEAPLPQPQDVALLIYTSGTTGLPKAAKVTHRRITEWCFWFAGMIDAKPHDRLYNCLPMYHSIGGVVAIGSMLVAGGSVVIRRRFSASNFWRDVTESYCTIFQYIGELCRYLTQAPPGGIPDHRLRLAVGNGLQADVWRTFQNRFAIPEVLEYYASTEGVLSLYNCDGRPGSIGRIPPPLVPYFPIRLIRVDEETGEPVRNAAGCCVVSGVDEPGEAICLMGKDRAFDGYKDAEATKRKTLENVFVEGDHWYRTGDLMRKDAAGFYYFLDRLGDTFRWKGENVSTTEVANVMRACPGVTDVIVYGVKMADQEGRAGMAAITTTAAFSFEQLAAHLTEHLPAYARPVFVRLCESLDTTGTFKLAKGRFVSEGYCRSHDPVWAFRERFTPLQDHTE